MRLGGPIFGKFDSPGDWAQAVKQAGYTAAYCPFESDISDEVLKEYIEVAKKEDIIMAEVGAWSNPISTDEAERRKAIAYCQEQLDLAERVGAKCCVNIAGSRGEQWDGPSADNYSDDTFALIVDTVREIIDAVKPKKTFYVLEPMPWVYPDSADSYLQLIHAIDRKGFAVHIDIVNVINSPVKYYRNGELIREWFMKLGPYIKSCHAKDIKIGNNLTLHFDEVVPGRGVLDYHTYIREVARLDPDMPFLLEHLKSPEQYAEAAAYVRKVAEECGVNL